jgi:hypothetical protein
LNQESSVLHEMSGFCGYLVFKMSDEYGWLDGYMHEQVDRLIGI